MTSAELEAHLDWVCEHDDDPFDPPEEYWDPEASAPPPGRDELTAEELAEVRQAAADDLLAVKAATTGRRGPGQPGSARVFPGESSGRAAGFAFTPARRDGPPGGYGTWTLRTPGPGPDLAVTLDPLTTDLCDHRHQASGHDPGARLRHLSQIRHATCTSPVCRRPASQADFEHNTPYEAGGRTCLCNGGPKCRHDHRLKQHPKWTVDQLPDGTFRWTTPAGRSYDTEPTRYPIRPQLCRLPRRIHSAPDAFGPEPAPEGWSAER
jgi:hypothetical protein